MSIIYPSINTSNFATLGSNTFIGTEIVTGSVSVTNLLSANSSSFNAVTLTGSLIYANPKVNITTANSGVVDQFTGSYKATRYTIMAETITGTYHVQTADVLLAHNNSNVLITPYAVTCTSGSYLASFDAQYSGSNIQLIATNLVASNIAVTMTKTYLA